MNNKNLGSVLHAAGWISIVVGVIIAIYMISKSSNSLFGGSEIATIGILLGLLFIILGIISLGIGQILLSTAEKQISASPRQKREYSSTKEDFETTTCPKCRQVYEGDFSGKFCEVCGSSLDSLSEDDVSESSSDFENVSTTCVMCGKVYPGDLSGKNCPNCNAPL